MENSIVDIVMVTYNQEKYIAQAIESVLMQKTDFPFQLIIGEDCSTDNTRDICIDYAQKFPHKIELILQKTNQGLLLNYKSLFDACTAKYLAILEGDDYWHDQFKIQKQISLLEKDPEIGFVYSDVNHLLEDNSILHYANKKKNKDTPVGSIFKSVFKKNTIPSLTACIKHELIKKHVNMEEFSKKNFNTIDLPLWLSITPYTKVAYIDDTTSTYRIHSESISNNKSLTQNIRFQLGVFKIRKHFLDKYEFYYLYPYLFTKVLGVFLKLSLATMLKYFTIKK
jgi:glycosyltransferase involved in cell wall biosynthesis